MPLIRGILAGIDPYEPAQEIIRGNRLPGFTFSPTDALSRSHRPGSPTPPGRPVPKPQDRCSESRQASASKSCLMLPDAVLTDEQWAEVQRYNLTDLGHTWDLLRRFAPELQALAALSEKQGRDFRSTPTPRVVEVVFLDAYRREHGDEPRRHAVPSEVTYRPVQGVVRPSTPAAAEWFDQITSRSIPIVSVGERQRVEVRRDQFSVGNLKLSVGSGGIHSVDAARVYYATRRHRLLSVNVASYYPSLIATKGISPRAYGDTGAATYRDILARRLEVKRQAKAVEDADERKPRHPGDGPEAGSKLDIRQAWRPVFDSARSRRIPGRYALSAS